MTDTVPEITTINDIIKETVQAVKQGQEQVFQIADMARDEYVKLQKEIENLNREIKEVIAEVDELERLTRSTRRRLMEVSRDFRFHTEVEIQAAYEEAQRAQVNLTTARTREQELRQRRDEATKRLHRLEKLVAKAETVVRNMQAAVKILTGKMDLLAGQLEGLRVRSQVGPQIIRAQEEERKRVAREIHDGPAQAMASIVLRLEICERMVTEGRGNIAEELGEIKSLAKSCLQEVRRVISDLRPMTLDELGLVPTVRRYLEEFPAQGGCPVQLEITGKERRLPDAVEVACFRLIQEALHNVRVHAKAGRAVVRLRFDPEVLSLSIEDNGVGFDVHKVMHQKDGREHFGLVTMRERIELLGGHFRLTSAPGEGTKVQATIPCTRGEADE